MQVVNRRLVADNNAVSPVVGVILMVAAVVLLSAVVFLIVSLASQDDSRVTPKVLTQSEDNQAGGGNLLVVGVNHAPSGGLRVSEISFTSSAGTCSFNGSPGPTLTAGTSITCTANGLWNMVWRSGQRDSVIVGHGKFPSS